ncbi:lipocalin family protein [Tamlana fucoidanivorans]|uniref:Lipocalin family protein n=1 Tax=Allotamlana fucoidanivorans TaxID=2583814 RepID=A0A5C4SL03_9FLAO|nr:lipocalin family protein [Tamlana fucoidanivorans]TNJ44677.1 lipocalin family protein [Tamlana fucoidanivorans]
MKTQSLIVYVAVFFLFFASSCSSNDDEKETPQQNIESQFVGVWKPVRFVIVCSGEDQDVENYTSCEQKGRLTINADGTWVETYFYEYIDDKCTEDVLEKGTWKIMDGALFVKYEGQEEEEATYFKVSKNSVKVGQYNPIFYCGDDASSYFYKEYIKL